MTNKTHFLNFGTRGLEERIIVIIIERGVSSKLCWKSKAKRFRFLEEDSSFFFFVSKERIIYIEVSSAKTIPVICITNPSLGPEICPNFFLFFYYYYFIYLFKIFLKYIYIYIHETFLVENGDHIKPYKSN